MDKSNVVLKLQILWRIVRGAAYLILGLFSAVCSDGNVLGDAEYCELDIFQPSCTDGEVIFMKSALYGRMALGRCIKQDYGHIGCKADVLAIMDGFCSGKQSCSVNANDRNLMSAKSKVCPSDMAGYLAPSYSCLKVQEMKPNECQSKGFFSLTAQSGYITPNSNSLPRGSTCTYRLLLSTGKINITIINFPPAPSIDKSGVASSACYEVGSIREGGQSKTIHKCLNDPRHKQLYLSNGGHVDILIPFKESYDVTGRFIIHYEGTGCSQPEVPSNAEVQRSNDIVRITCRHVKKSWELKCIGDTWHGEAGECTDSKENGWSFLGLFDHEHPYGTAIVVGIGATLGVLSGGILLYILIAIFKRCNKSDYTMTYEYTDPNFAHIPTDYHADKSNLLIQDDKLFEQNSNTWGSQHHGNGNTLSRGGTDHSRVPLPPLPNDNNTLSYKKPLFNRNGNV